MAQARISLFMLLSPHRQDADDGDANALFPAFPLAYASQACEREHARRDCFRERMD